MEKSARSHKQSLECLRLESACQQLAGRVRNPALQLHFVRMAQVWNGLASEGTQEGIVEQPAAAGRAA